MTVIVVAYVADDIGQPNVHFRCQKRVIESLILSESQVRTFHERSRTRILRVRTVRKSLNNITEHICRSTSERKPKMHRTIIETVV